MAHDNQSRHLPGDPEGHHIVSYKFLIGIWVGLIMLTILTVLVSVMGISLVAFSVITAMIIAATKATVVANYFMHLKFDNPLLKILFGVTMFLFLTFMGFTAIDYITR